LTNNALTVQQIATEWMNTRSDGDGDGDEPYRRLCTLLKGHYQDLPECWIEVFFLFLLRTKVHALRHLDMNSFFNFMNNSNNINFLFDKSLSIPGFENVYELLKNSKVSGDFLNSNTDVSMPTRIMMYL
jgi:hypothetical protein